MCQTDVAAVNAFGNSTWPFVFQRMIVVSQHSGHVGFVKWGSYGIKTTAVLLPFFILLLSADECFAKDKQEAFFFFKCKSSNELINFTHKL